MLIQEGRLQWIAQPGSLWIPALQASILPLSQADRLLFWTDVRHRINLDVHGKVIYVLNILIVIKFFLLLSQTKSNLYATYNCIVNVLCHSRELYGVQFGECEYRLN